MLIELCIWLTLCFVAHACRWRQQHEYLEKLNIQAVLNASQNEDEFVKEFLINHEKVSNLLTCQVFSVVDIFVKLAKLKFLVKVAILIFCYYL